MVHVIAYVPNLSQSKQAVGKAGPKYFIATAGRPALFDVESRRRAAGAIGTSRVRGRRRRCWMAACGSYYFQHYN